MYLFLLTVHIALGVITLGCVALVFLRTIPQTHVLFRAHNYRAILIYLSALEFLTGTFLAVFTEIRAASLCDNILVYGTIVSVALYVSRNKSAEPLTQPALGFLVGSAIFFIGAIALGS